MYKTRYVDDKGVIIETALQAEVLAAGTSTAADGGGALLNGLKAEQYIADYEYITEYKAASGCGEGTTCEGCGCEAF